MPKGALPRLAVVLGLAGLAVSVYLTITHYEGTRILACPEHGLVNCAKVTTSSYATQHGIPLAVLGVVFFAGLTALQWLPAPTLRVAVSAIGAVTALWLIYVELYRLDAICLYCTAVHALAIALFAVTVIDAAQAAPRAR